MGKGNRERIKPKELFRSMSWWCCRFSLLSPVMPVMSLGCAADCCIVPRTAFLGGTTTVMRRLSWSQADTWWNCCWAVSRSSASHGFAVCPVQLTHQPNILCQSLLPSFGKLWALLSTCTCKQFLRRHWPCWCSLELSSLFAGPLTMRDVYYEAKIYPTKSHNE